MAKETMQAVNDAEAAAENTARAAKAECERIISEAKHKAEDMIKDYVRLANGKSSDFLIKTQRDSDTKKSEMVEASESYIETLRSLAGKNTANAKAEIIRVVF